MVSDEHDVLLILGSLVLEVLESVELLKLSIVHSIEILESHCNDGSYLEALDNAFLMLLNETSDSVSELKLLEVADVGNLLEVLEFATAEFTSKVSPDAFGMVCELLELEVGDGLVGNHRVHLKSFI